LNKLKLEELVGKYIRIEYIDSNKDFGNFEGFDNDLKIIHLRDTINKEDLLIPLSSVKSITEVYT